MNIRNKRQARRMSDGLCMLGGIPLDISIPEWMKNHSASLAAEILLRKGNKEDAVEVLTNRLKKQKGVREEEYVFGLIRLLYGGNQLEKALDILLDYIHRKPKKAKHPYIKKLRVLIEGHIYLTKHSLVGSKIWSKSTLDFLKNKFDFDILVLYMEISRKILQEPEKQIELSFLSAVDIKNEEYLSSAYSPKELKLLLELLTSRGIPSQIVKRTYIKRNPLLDKSELLSYFKSHKDKDLLLYVLERRPLRELKEYAIRENIYTKDVEVKYEGVSWEDALLRLRLSKQSVPVQHAQHVPIRQAAGNSFAISHTVTHHDTYGVTNTHTVTNMHTVTNSVTNGVTNGVTDHVIDGVIDTHEAPFPLYRTVNQESEEEEEEYSDLGFLDFLEE
ncbi:hypothetical protein NEFER03_2078 [Nematocida sp. LUAm3]|nr:hypothetical protein NEFER03_2078 [Nematocida sp. LUAm3]KAI5176204.1 hypothetical protein NEFER02_2010 [Nematocida sp. LUAm2]KAI5179192.1 hypothetical protein NEFER01_2049 [Nematocida sp. LUAm1]